jgi:hypothetical protein
MVRHGAFAYAWDLVGDPAALIDEDAPVEVCSIPRTCSRYWM